MQNLNIDAHSSLFTFWDGLSLYDVQRALREGWYYQGNFNRTESLNGYESKLYEAVFNGVLDKLPNILLYHKKQPETQHTHPRRFQNPHGSLYEAFIGSAGFFYKFTIVKIYIFFFTFHNICILDTTSYNNCKDERTKIKAIETEKSFQQS